MIYLITGTPGSGKSLLAVQWILQWRREGRPVYADIEGLAVDGVDASPDDWRDSPEGSVVVYDEAQRLFSGTGRSGRSERDDVQALETHRHTGHDIVLTTQNPTLVHHHVRKLVGEHHHLERVFGTERASVFHWSKAINDTEDKVDRQKADVMVWRFPRSLYGYYSSATVHTQRRYIPKKLIWLSVFIVGMLALVSYSVMQIDFGPNGSQPVNEQSPGKAESVQPDEPSTSQSNGRSMNRIRDRSGANTQPLGGDISTFRGGDVTEHWSITGVLETDDHRVFILRGQSRSMRVPNDRGFDVLNYSGGILRIRGPGGEMLVTWQTGPDQRDRGPAQLTPGLDGDEVQATGLAETSDR